MLLAEYCIVLRWESVDYSIVGKYYGTDGPMALNLCCQNKLNVLYIYRRTMKTFYTFVKSFFKTFLSIFTFLAFGKCI